MTMNKKLYALTNEQANWLSYYAMSGGEPELDDALTPLNKDAAVERMARALAESLHDGDFWDDYLDDGITLTINRESYRKDARAALDALLEGGRMKTYEVIYEGTVRETYLVEANSEDDAKNNWHQKSMHPLSSEMIDGEVTSVREDK